MSKIFISHCEADKPVVKGLVQMIRNVCDLTREEIFCTSIVGMGCTAGNIFNEEIRHNFKESTIIVALLTKNYKFSEFCMAELGASWISKEEKRFIPLIDSDVNYDFFKGVLVGVHELKIDRNIDLSQLCNIICEELGKEKRLDVSLDEVNSFLENYPTNKSNCPTPFLCTEADWQKMIDEKNTIEEDYNAACNVIKEQKAYIKELQLLKDATEVASLAKKMNQSEIDEFQECVDAVICERSNFDRPVFKFVVYNLLNLGDPYLDEYDWSQLSKATSSKILKRNSDEQYYVNYDNLHVKDLSKALDTYIEMVQSADDEIRDFYSKKLNVDFDIENSEFNDKMLDL